MNLIKKKFKLGSTNPVFLITAIFTLILFFFSSLRHSLFQSGALDLGFFDQGIYLISQGINPKSSIIDIHLLGDHAAFILYPLSVFYRIYPDIHWLFLIQAIAIAIGIIPVVCLSQLQGLTNKQIYLAILIYTLSPILFNVNSTYDFHPDIFAIPFLLWSVFWARINKINLFCISIIIVLSCKAVFSLTVIFLGLWLFLFEKKKQMGIIAITIGIVWFVIATQVVMPMVGAGTTRFLFRYSSLGSSYLEIIINLFVKPNLLLSKIFTVDSLFYLLLLFAPFVWSFKFMNVNYLMPAIPTIVMSILSVDTQQRYLANHYPLPVFPFLMLVAISSIGTFTKQRRWGYRFIIFWAILAFVTMSEINLFTGKYLQSLDTWQASNKAIALVKTKGSILTTHEISPHVSHRPQVKLAFSNTPHDLTTFDYILLNTRHAGYRSDRDYALSLVEQAKKIPSLKLEYYKDDVYLFTKH